MDTQRDDRSVTVIHGANDGIFDLGGCTVAAVQKSADAFNVGSDAATFVNGQEVASTFMLSAGDRLEFVYRNGYKGLGDLLTPEDLMNRWRISSDEYHDLQQRGLPTIAFKNGTVRHPEVSVDQWWKNIGFPSLDVQMVERQDSSRSWKNSATADPPLTHQFGPIVGNLEQLGSWLHPDRKPDARYLKGRAESGVIWVKTIHSRLYEVWFKTQGELDRVKLRSDEKLPKSPEPT